MTDSLPPVSSDTPQPERYFSSSAPPSLALNISAAVVSLATIGAITAGWLRGRFEQAPWWGAPGALLIAGMAAADRARLLGTAVRRVLPGRNTTKE